MIRKRSQGLARKKLSQLDLSLWTEKAKMKVVDVECPILRKSKASPKHTTFLLERYRQVDVLFLVEGEARQDGVAILATAANANIGMPRVVMKTKHLAEHLGLVVKARALAASIDLLEHDDIRLVVGDRFANPFRLVAPIKPANALVDVVAKKANPHAKIVAGVRCL